MRKISPISILQNKILFLQYLLHQGEPDFKSKLYQLPHPKKQSHHKNEGVTLHSRIHLANNQEF